MPLKQAGNVELVRAAESAMFFRDFLGEQSIGAYDGCLAMGGLAQRSVDDHQVIADGIKIIEIPPCKVAENVSNS